MQMLFIFAILFPLLFSVPVYFLGKKNGPLRDWLTVGAAALALVSAVGLLLSGGARAEAPGLFGLGLSFRADGLRGWMAVLAGIIWLGSALLSVEYFSHHARTERYQMFSLMTLSATMGVFLSDDLYTLFVFFEMMSFTSYALVKHEETDKALRAGQTYLAMSVSTGLVSLMGIFMLYAKMGTLSFDAMLLYADKQSLYIPAVLTLFGFAAKAGMFPMHVWLPEAHPAAPAPASALLSCILTKTGVFGLMVLSARLLRGEAEWGVLLLVPSAITMVLGAVLALLSTDLKRTLACSSLSQIGFVLTGLATLNLLGQHGQLAAMGTITHITNHALIKLTLFGAAGVVYKNLHELDLNKIRGFGRGKPLLMIVFLLGALSISGIPGFGGYVSKTLIHESLLEYSGAYGALVSVVEVLFVISGGFTLAYMTKLFVCLFVEKGEGERSGRYMTPVTAGVLIASGLTALLFGIFPGLSLEKIAAIAAPFLGAEAEAGVPYFSQGNLLGGLKSILIGVLTYFAVVRPLLMKDGRYVNRLPKWLSLENAVYRPVVMHVVPMILGALAYVAAAAVQMGTGLLNRFVFTPKNPRREPPVNSVFGVYAKEPFLRQGFTDTLAFSFTLMGVGLVAALLYLIFH